MARMAAGFDWADRARARAAQAAAIPASWRVFPAGMERRVKILRRVGAVESIMLLKPVGEDSSGPVSHVIADIAPPTHSQRAR